MKRRALWLTLMAFVVLCGGVALWVQRERQQYARNRQLIAALEKDDTKTALALVNAGADPNTYQEALPAPTFKSLLSRLLHHSPPPVNYSPTALFIACGQHIDPAYSTTTHEDVRLVRAMLTHGANLNARLPDKETALCIAIHEERQHTVELLLQNDAAPNALDEMGGTPLMCAAGTENHDIVGLLLAYGAKPNLQDMDGNSALYYAFQYEPQRRIIAKLLAAGADPKWHNGEITLLMLARLAKRPDIVRLLQQHGAK